MTAIGAAAPGARSRPHGIVQRERIVSRLTSTPDVVVLLGGELVALLVPPLLVGGVLPFHEDRGRVPVVTLAWEVAAAVEQQDALSRRSELPRERPSTRAAADDDDVIVLSGCHGASWFHPGRCEIDELGPRSPYSPGLVCMSPPSVNTVVAVT